MMVMGATRQLVSEGEGRARQEINNIERQVFGFINPASIFEFKRQKVHLAEMYSAGVTTGKHALQRAGKAIS